MYLKGFFTDGLILEQRHGLITLFEYRMSRFHLREVKTDRLCHDTARRESNHVDILEGQISPNLSFPGPLSDNRRIRTHFRTFLERLGIAHQQDEFSGPLST
jgi:hypothetical protein